MKRILSLICVLLLFLSGCGGFHCLVKAAQLILLLYMGSGANTLPVLFFQAHVIHPLP